MASPSVGAGVFEGCAVNVGVVLGSIGVGELVGRAVGMKGVWVAAGKGVSVKVLSTSTEVEKAWFC